MSDQGHPQQRQRSNAYDQAPPAYAPPYQWPHKVPEYKIVDPNALYISIAKATAGAVLLVGAVLYANNFQRDTQHYQANMTNEMTLMRKSLESMTTSRDLSDFCMQAQAENVNWKCPPAFHWRRQGSMQPKSDKVRIQLGSR